MRKYPSSIWHHRSMADAESYHALRVPPVPTLDLDLSHPKCKSPDRGHHALSIVPANEPWIRSAAKIASKPLGRYRFSVYCLGTWKVGDEEMYIEDIILRPLVQTNGPDVAGFTFRWKENSNRSKAWCRSSRRRKPQEALKRGISFWTLRISSYT